MKKALTLITIATLAAMTQAATIEWDSGTIYLPNSEKAGKNSVTASLYLITSADYTALDLTTAEGQQSALNTYLAKTADVTGATAKTGIATLATNGDATSEASPQYVVLIYQYGTGDDAQYKLGKGTDYLNDLGAQAKIKSSNLAETSWVTKSSGGQDPVPEPTTVALLALGLAAVGLKRKVA